VTASYFVSAESFRGWLEHNHATASELLVGFYNKTSGRGGLTYPEALDEALCFGWIDGIRKRVDAHSYTIRFTPRKPASIWSLVNVRHFERLKQRGRIQPTGQTAFDRRDPQKTGVYSFEQRPQKFPPAWEKVFRANKKAWTFWQQQPPGYRRIALWWVISAKQDETRQRRLTMLIASSAAGKRLQ
jgi:uncharacterized protein YdeI (YjbR/CyaY-like superfamily)